MAKPATFQGYSSEYTLDCERVLVTLLRGLGPWKESMDSVASMFREALAGKHGPVVREALSILRRRFTGDDGFEGFRMDGPVAVARFEKGEGGEPELREARLLRQREVSDVVERLLALLHKERDLCGRVA